jgi:hypothetical protein
LLPAAVATYPGRWIEYGVLEAAYADSNPADFNELVTRYGHTAIKATQYSASAFISFTLGRLSRNGSVLGQIGPATGRWSYNSEILWWTLPPSPSWADRLSWAELGRSMTTSPAALNRGRCAAA